MNIPKNIKLSGICKGLLPNSARRLSVPLAWQRGMMKYSMQNIFSLFFIIPMFLHAGNFDSLKCIELNAAYGIGNYVPGFYDSNYPSNRSYSEFLIKLEGSVYKQGGIIFTFNRILKTEKGFDCCECWPPKNYSYRLKGYYGSLSLYLNWKYFGFK